MTSDFHRLAPSVKARSQDEVSDQQSTTPAGKSHDHRRHRDAPPSSLVMATPATNRPLRQLPDTIEKALERGHPWLRFSHALEAEFQQDTLAARRALLLICSLIGLLSLKLNTAKVVELSPDIAEYALRIVNTSLVIGPVLLAMTWATPVRWQRAWQAEALTFANTAWLSVGTIYACMISHEDTTFTHSAGMVCLVLYSGIAARQRFAWSLATALLAFLGYWIFVTGHTPLQQRIVHSNLKLMLFSFTFVLLANYLFERRERRTWLLRRLEEQQRRALIETSERLRVLSSQDALTGLYNRRQFDAELKKVWAKASHERHPVSLLTVDVDFFKRYNDTYGHPAGDACLIQIGQLIAQLAQEHKGMGSRLGGEEFTLLLPGHAFAEAMKIGTALCERVNNLGIAHRTSTVSTSVSVSVGAAQAWPTSKQMPDSLVKHSDHALYKAKEGGRNRVYGVERLPTSEGEPSPAVHEDTVINETDRDKTDLMGLEASYLTTLRTQFRLLRFPRSQEVAYLRQRDEQSLRYLAPASVMGMALYNIYFLAGQNMFPDVVQKVFGVQIGLALMMGFLLIYSHRKKLSARQRQLQFSLGSSAMALASAWALSQSQELSALHFSMCLFLIPMFSSILALQSFSLTLVTAVATCLSIPLFFKPGGHPLALVDTISMVLTNVVCCLILAYTSEHGNRKKWLLGQVEHLQRDALLSMTKRLHQLAALDPLTGLSNRRQFEDDFQRIWNEQMNTCQPLALLIIDIDFFKQYNDGYGHPEGDKCLKQVATAIALTARNAKALSARLGGEEFCILLPGGDMVQAIQLGERVCHAVRTAGIAHGHTQVPGQAVVTVSVGAASVTPEPDQNRSALLALADGSLYQAKNAGRNRVAGHTRPEPSL